MTPLSTFKSDKDKSEITYADYYFKAYKIKIKDMKQPLLLHNKKERTPEGKRIIVKIYLIPELVRMTGLTDRMRQDRRCMKEIGDNKPTYPNDRIREI